MQSMDLDIQPGSLEHIFIRCHICLKVLWESFKYPILALGFWVITLGRWLSIDVACHCPMFDSERLRHIGDPIRHFFYPKSTHSLHNDLLMSYSCLLHYASWVLYNVPCPTQWKEVLWRSFKLYLVCRTVDNWRSMPSPRVKFLAPRLHCILLLKLLYTMYICENSFPSGCDTGMGHRMAMRFDEMQMHVFAGCLRPEGSGAQKLKSTCSSRLHIVPLDITDEEQVKAAVKYVKANLPDGQKGEKGMGHYFIIRQWHHIWREQSSGQDWWVVWSHKIL